MDKNQWYTSKDDLFESGKAYRNSLFGGGPSGGSPHKAARSPDCHPAMPLMIRAG